MNQISSAKGALGKVFKLNKVFALDNKQSSNLFTVKEESMVIRYCCKDIVNMK